MKGLRNTVLLAAAGAFFTLPAASCAKDSKPADTSPKAVSSEDSEDSNSDDEDGRFQRRGSCRGERGP
ncbi:MAG: hypothetical protein GY811_31045 [Myxococcales bacterium]|nr:hypothetical protein [Myxococcales bacterium]